MSAGLPRAVAAHLGSEQVSRVVYGAIIGLALVVALENHPPRAIAMAGSLFATGLAVALAEWYSELLGIRTREHRRASPEEAHELHGDVLAVGFGIAFPATFFVLAALGVFDEDTAFGLAKWTGLGLIAFYGYCAERLGGGSQVSALLGAAAVALVAAGLIAFKALLH
jgi:hypothetical protein